MSYPEDVFICILLSLNNGMDSQVKFWKWNAFFTILYFVLKCCAKKIKLNPKIFLHSCKSLHVQKQGNCTNSVQVLVNHGTMLPLVLWAQLLASSAQAQALTLSERSWQVKKALVGVRVILGPPEWPGGWWITARALPKQHDVLVASLTGCGSKQGTFGWCVDQREGNDHSWKLGTFSRLQESLLSMCHFWGPI